MVFAVISMFGTALGSMSKSDTEFKRPPTKVTFEINSRKHETTTPQHLFWIARTGRSTSDYRKSARALNHALLPLAPHECWQR